MRTLVAVLAVVAVVIGLFLSIRVAPPGDAARLAVAQGLEPVVGLVDELRIDGWSACEGCRPLVLRPGSDTVVGSTPAWTTMAQAVDGAVPGARVVAIDVAGDEADPGSRTVSFTVVPRLWWGADALQDRWTWTWHATPPSTQPDSVNRTWTFTASSPGDG